MRRKLVAGNWKMNGVEADLAQLDTLVQSHSAALSEILICPPATLIHRASTKAQNTSVTIGAQDCHAKTSGAHTGDLSAQMLKDAGARYVILGHSERRADHGEFNEHVRAKARAVLEAGLTAIVCMGEDLAEREADNTLDIIAGQLAGSLPDDVEAGTLVVAYEPIWAIGTGKVPSSAQIAEVHDFIRARLERRYGPQVASTIRILYGGSVKAANATEIFAIANVDGALVGGASLKAEDFTPIIQALDAS